MGLQNLLRKFQINFISSPFIVSNNTFQFYHCKSFHYITYKDIQEHSVVSKRIIHRKYIKIRENGQVKGNFQFLFLPFAIWQLN